MRNSLNYWCLGILSSEHTIRIHSNHTIVHCSLQMSPPDINPAEVCNINVGVMGHVDSGKTSLGS